MSPIWQSNLLGCLNQPLGIANTPTEKMDSRIVDMKPIQFVDLRNLLEKILERGGVALPECVGLSGSSGRLNCTYNIYLYQGVALESFIFVLSRWLSCPRRHDICKTNSFQLLSAERNLAIASLPISLLSHPFSVRCKWRPFRV